MRVITLKPRDEGEVQGGAGYRVQGFGFWVSGGYSKTSLNLEPRLGADLSPNMKG